MEEEGIREEDEGSESISVENEDERAHAVRHGRLGQDVQSNGVSLHDHHHHELRHVHHFTIPNHLHLIPHHLSLSRLSL